MALKHKLLSIALSTALLTGATLGAPLLTTRASAQTLYYTSSSITSFKGNIQIKKGENSDTVGWLRVPNTTIHSAIVQNPYSKGNAYYLSHGFDKKISKYGTYCADRRCTFGNGTRDELSHNTVLYAHNFDDDPDGQLFAQLKKFKNSKFAKNTPYIFFSTEAEDMVWEVFAVYDTTTDFPYVWPELSSSTNNHILNFVYAASIYDYGVNISPTDKILTLSTCTFSVNNKIKLPLNKENKYRFVVMARLVGTDEALKNTASFTVNKSPLAADDMPDLYNMVFTS